MTARSHSNTAPPRGLTAGINAAATELLVGTTAGFPAPPYTLVIERATPNQEVVLCTSALADRFVVTRGFDGTTAVAHGNNALVEHTVAALDYAEANAHINGPHVYPSLADAKGDLLVGTANDVVGRLAVGANGFSPVAESSAAEGIRWEQSRGTIVCTSTTRPTLGLYAGVRIYETDSKLFYMYTGAAWMPEPGQMLGYVETTTNSPYTTGVTSRLTLNFVMPALAAGRRVKLTGTCYYLALAVALNNQCYAYGIIGKGSGQGVGSVISSSYLSGATVVGLPPSVASIDNTDIPAGPTTMAYMTHAISPNGSLSHCMAAEPDGPAYFDAVIV